MGVLGINNVWALGKTIRKMLLSKAFGVYMNIFCYFCEKFGNYG